MSHGADPTGSENVNIPVQDVIGGRSRRGSVNPFMQVHQLLLGHYLWALAAGIFLGLLFGTLVFLWLKPEFHVVGTIHIRPKAVRLNFTNEPGDGPPMYESFIDTQVVLLQSGPILAEAMNSAAWKDLAQKRMAYTPSEFANRLEVSNPKNTELIQIEYRDPDHDVASSAVKALIGAYIENARAKAGVEEAGLMRILAEHQGNLSRQLADSEKRKLEYTAEFGTDNLEPLLKSKMERLEALESEIRDIEKTTGGSVVSSASTQRTAPIVPMRDEATSDKPNGKTPPGKRSLLSLPELRALRDRSQEDIADLERKFLAIRNLKHEADSVQKTLDDVNSRIEQTSFGSLGEGRLDVLSWGELDPRANKNKRLPATSMAAILGFFVGVGGIALVGLFSRKINSTYKLRQIFESKIPILGLLPAKNTNGPLVSRYVDQISTLLQLGQPSGSRPIMAITCAKVGEDSSEFVYELGRCYAAMGTKTLLVDFDNANGRLTSRVDVFQELSIIELLKKRGLIEPGRLAELVKESQKTRLTLKELLLRQNLVPRAEIDLMLGGMAAEHRAFSEKLRGLPLAGRVENAGDSNLSVLRRDGATHSSMCAIRKGLEAARHHFDVIFINTAPLLEDLQGCVIAAAVDEVIVVIANGQDQESSDLTFSHLYDVHARIAGVVFSDASVKDLAKYGIAISSGVNRSAAI